MLTRVYHTLRYQLERFLVRGPFSRLLLVMAMILGISALGGWFSYFSTGQFRSAGEAVWWAFLRLTDPGYLGDDQGLLLRSVSTVITILGYVIFLGALVAIMTQWFHQTMRRLSAGTTPMARKNHIVILGASNRTPTILRELFLSSGRVRRFLRARGSRRLHVAILSEEFAEDLLHELEVAVGPKFRRSNVTIRSGSPRRPEHLSRVDYAHSSAIVVPADSERKLVARDEETIKTLLSLGLAMKEQEVLEPPLLVAEVSTEERAHLARRAYPGEAEVLPTEQMVAWILAQEVECPGALPIFDELVAREDGHRIYVNPAGHAAGSTILELLPRFERAVVFGVLRGGARSEVQLNPPPHFRVESEDRLLTIASDLAHARPFGTAKTIAMPEYDPIEFQGSEGVRRVLLLGFSQKVPLLVDALGGAPIHAQSIDIFSRVPRAERETYLERHCPNRRRERVRHLEGDITSRRDLSRLDWDAYDHVVVVASDLTESDSASDARTILCCLALSEVLELSERRPHITAELLESDSARLLRGRGVSTLRSAAIPSMLLTQVTLHRELALVFDDLFRPAGSDIRLASPSELGIAHGKYRFLDLQVLCLSRGTTLLGIRQRDARSAESESRLVPGHDAHFPLDERTQLIVFVAQGRRSTEI